VGEGGAEGFGDPPGECEAEADAGFGFCGLGCGFVEGFEDAGAVFFGDAGAIVGDVDGEGVVGGFGGDENGGWVCLASVFCGVVDEVEEDVFDGVGVGVEGDLGDVGDFEVHSGGGEACGEAFAEVFD
jgi:hypothetical protein